MGRIRRPLLHDASSDTEAILVDGDHLSGVGLGSGVRLKWWVEVGWDIVAAGSGVGYEVGIRGGDWDAGGG